MACDFFNENIVNIPDGRFWEKDGNIYIIPDGMPDLSNLRILRSGLLCGSVKNGRFSPSQSLAMCLKEGDAVSEARLEKDDERVIRYLKGESIDFGGIKDTWCLVKSDRFPIGWAKSQKGRLKNKYSLSWRWE